MIGQAMQGSLKDASYAVDWIKDGESALSAFATQSYDMVLLDLGLPKKDGLEVLRRIRSSDDRTPILIVTARDSLESRVKGLDLGADDYVLKPFAMAELLARMRAIWRRKAGMGDPILLSESLSLDPSTHEVTAEHGESQQLSNREFSLLLALMVRPGAILSRKELEDRVYGWGEEVESNAIEFLIHALRKKLGKPAIKNIRGAGWMVSKRS